MKNYIILVFLSLTVFGCMNSPEKNNSYILKEESGKCEGSILSVDEQVMQFQAGAKYVDISCFTRPVELANGELLIRAACRDLDKGILPITNFTESKKSCELARKALNEQPGIGLIPNKQMEEMPEGLWVVGIEHEICMLMPVANIEELVAGLQQELGSVCEVELADVPGESIRVITCGDNHNGVAWVVTESEPICQMIIKGIKDEELKQEEQQERDFFI
jgi:hypothetical protein